MNSGLQTKMKMTNPNRNLKLNSCSKTIFSLLIKDFPNEY